MLPTLRNRTSASPFGAFWGAHREFDRMINELMDANTRGATPWDLATDVRETEHAIDVEIEMPGMDAGAIDVTIEDNVLTVSGEKRLAREEKDTNGEYRMIERRHGRFSRSFTLPRTVDANRIDASYENGVLHLTLPKSEEAKPRRIAVSPGNGGQRIEAGESK